MPAGQRVSCHRTSLKSFGGDSGKQSGSWRPPHMCNEGRPLCVHRQTIPPNSEAILAQLCCTPGLGNIAGTPLPLGTPAVCSGSA